MATYDVFWKASTKTVYICADGTAAPAGTVSLGTFDHGDDADDNLGNDGVVGTENHAVWSHIRDLLFAQDVLDAFNYNLWFIASAIAAYPAAPTIDLSNGETAQITVDPTPANSHVSYTYASSDETKATVNADGLITPVAAGTSNITVTDTISGKTDVVAVTVQA